MAIKGQTKTYSRTYNRKSWHALNQQTAIHFYQNGKQTYSPTKTKSEPHRHKAQPRQVLAASRAVIIYLASALLQRSSCLPSGIGRAALNRRYTWHFSM